MADPAFIQIADEFRELIDNGDFRPGARLPANTEVALLKGVSKETASKAFRLLREQGYVYSTWEGTFVQVGARTGENPQRREELAEVLRFWESQGAIGPAWTARWDGGERCYRITFLLFATWGPAPRYYDFSEAEFCLYVRAVADWMPDEAGEAAIALVEEEQEET